MLGCSQKQNAAVSAAIVLFLGILRSISIFVVNAAPLEDLIEALPMWGRTATPHFSGYLDASEGCDIETNGPICKIHYWLALASNDDVEKDSSGDDEDASFAYAYEKPTVLWLNGGPGASSLLGWLQEVGPLLFNATGGLMNNPYSWTNANINLLAIEAPMGVGFSYCSRQVDLKKPCINSDTSTAKASRAAIVDFFTNKFPELSNGPFYISGESYAGVYIPTLSRELLMNAKDTVPLKGILVGDPCTDNVAQKDSMDPLWYSNKYGLMDSEIYDTLMSEECAKFTNNSILLNSMMSSSSTATTTTKLFLSSKSHRSVGKQRSHYVTAAELNKELLTIKDLMERRIKALELFKERVLGLTNEGGDDKHVEEEESLQSSTSSSTKCTLAWRKFLFSSSKALSQGWKDVYIDDYSLFAPVTSKEDEQQAAYFNRHDVRTALHVTDTSDAVWPMDPNIGFSYEKEFNACNWDPTAIKYKQSMVDIYQQIVPLLDRTWIYNGDTDPCVSYEGTREAVKQILLPELDGGSYRPWFYNQTKASIDVLASKAILFGPNLVAQDLDIAQFGGEVVDYRQGLKFLTFHGSGHMVPQFRPQAALHFLTKFLHGNGPNDDNDLHLLSPLLPSNTTLELLTEDEFLETMNEWTELAMKEPYV